MVVRLQLFSFENQVKTSLSRFDEPLVQSSSNPINSIISQASPGFFFNFVIIAKKVLL